MASHRLEYSCNISSAQTQQRFHFPIKPSPPIAYQYGYKIISKTLALRIESVILSIIHSDQTGSIKRRHSTNDLYRLFNLMHYRTQTNSPMVMVSLDAEKAFDKVNWLFLFSTLKKMALVNHLYTGLGSCIHHQWPRLSPMD